MPYDYALFAKKEVLSRGFHVRASSLPVETHCEDGGWIQPGLNLFSFSDAIKTLVNWICTFTLVLPYRS